ncbi:arginase [Pseudonocardia hierapolitana]|uniref:Arginase n=1 Tax=Pseudonocardia hierapolitana TaxID=1128676 RepID=A0A561SY35_9PSEU|nr:arginase [Pseudonocardia hierapolitana]
MAVIGVASSAGTHHAGQDRAPAALRAGGLIERLRAAGVTVEDRGDLVHEVFVADDMGSNARNLAAVVRVARAVADAVGDALAGGALPLILGGDCTISLGVVAGAQRQDPAVGLLYLDGDADLATPETTGSGVLDAMGIAHLLGLADTELARLGAGPPMLTDERLALLGYDESDPETYAAGVLRDRPALVHFADHQVRADPAGCARTALAAVQSHASSLIVHFDVDAVDSRDLPLANFPHYGTGISLRAAGEVLAVLCGAPALAAIVLTEVNPSYDPGGHQLTRYIETVTGAIARGLAPTS